MTSEAETSSAVDPSASEGATTPLPQPTHVLSVEAVRWGIAALQREIIHNYFFAYVHMNRLTRGEAGHVNEDWDELKSLLAVDGGPPGKPHFRPINYQVVRDQKTYWTQDNLRGLWQASNLDGSKPAGFLLDPEGGLALPANHASQALDRFRRGNRVPAHAVAAYLLRNFGFTLPDVSPGEEANELIAAFRQHFFYADTAPDNPFDTLFDATPPQVDFDWFEPITEAMHDA